MKKLLILLVALSCAGFAQTAKNQLKHQNNTAPIVVDKKAQLRIQAGNKSNSKYLNRYNYQNNNQTIVCESVRGRRNHCTIDTRYGVNLVRQLSGSTCNYHWGYDNTGIWVDGGCRAEFSINLGWDQPGAEGNIMVCESHNYQRNYCPAYLGGRDVFLLRQVSNSSCVNNWGYDRNGVWVTNGCRAEFVVEDRSYNFGNDIVVCSSRNRRFQGCPADTRGGVEFLRQLSRASCNGNWGYDRQGIWVNNGCRAKFRLIPYQNYGNNGYGNNSNIVSCSSRHLKRRFCNADTSGGVRLKRQKSRSPCRGNWGFDRNGIWVTNGCRATFELYVDGRGRGYNNGGFNNGNNGYSNNGHPHNGNNGYGTTGPYNNGNNGYGNNGNLQNNTLICSSRNLKRNACAIPQGAKITMKKQLSKSSCAGNWGYNRYEVWVNNGCRAQFNIY